MTKSTDDDTEEANTELEADRDEQTADHLDNVDDGCGCTEIWEYLSKQRNDD